MMESSGTTTHIEHAGQGPASDYSPAPSPALPVPAPLPALARPDPLLSRAKPKPKPKSKASKLKKAQQANKVNAIPDKVPAQTREDDSEGDDGSDLAARLLDQLDSAAVGSKGAASSAAEVGSNTLATGEGQDVDGLSYSLSEVLRVIPSNVSVAAGGDKKPSRQAARKVRPLLLIHYAASPRAKRRPLLPVAQSSSSRRCQSGGASRSSGRE